MPQENEQSSKPESQANNGNEPDVFLDVPRLNVGELNLEVEKLNADVSIKAQLAKLINIEVGAKVNLENVNLELKEVAAQAQLNVRLDKIEKIFLKSLQFLEANPDAIQYLGEGNSGEGSGEQKENDKEEESEDDEENEDGNLASVKKAVKKIIRLIFKFEKPMAKQEKKQIPLENPDIDFKFSAKVKNFKKNSASKAEVVHYSNIEQYHYQENSRKNAPKELKEGVEYKDVEFNIRRQSSLDAEGALEDLPEI